MESIWTRTVTMDDHPALNQDISFDAAIIGGGIAGILTAYFLQQSGLHVAVFEASAVGMGTTAYTTAKITSQHGLFYQNMLSKFGPEISRLYASSHQKAISSYAKLIETENIDCDFSLLPSYLYDTVDNPLLIAETEAAKFLGIPAAFTKDTELPFSVYGAVKLDNQAQFHPLKFLNHLARQLEVYEHTTITHIAKQSLTAKTSSGTFQVSAKMIVVTTHYPMKNVPGFYFTRLHQSLSYLSAWEGVTPLHGIYLSAIKNGHTMRSYDSVLLFGGLGHRTGQSEARNPYKQFASEVNLLFPDAKELCHWSAEDCMSLDEIPYIGNYSAATPWLYVATGFKKWGMTGAMVAALLLNDMIRGIPNELKRLYRPNRLTIQASALPFAKHMGITLNSLVLKKFTLGKKHPPNCTHLGCTLNWNASDETWECPCHGSRFSKEGLVLNNPTHKPLKNLS